MWKHLKSIAPSIFKLSGTSAEILITSSPHEILILRLGFLLYHLFQKILELICEAQYLTIDHQGI